MSLTADGRRVLTGRAWRPRRFFSNLDRREWVESRGVQRGMERKELDAARRGWRRSCLPGLRGITAFVALVGLAVVAATPARGARMSQILRPQGQGSTEILQTDRVARLVLALPVSPEIAFDAWTDANQLVEWLSHWAEMTVSENEEFRLGWEGYDGVWQGRYLEIDRPGRLVFTWLPPEEVFPAGAYESIITLTFEEVEEGRTTMMLEHSGFRDTPELEAQLQVWRGYLFALRAFLLQPPSAQ